jgi:hypothetical protein
MTMSGGEIIVLDGLTISTWRNLAVNQWHGRVTVELLRALRPPIRALKARHPRGTATLTILDSEHLSRLGPAERREAALLAGEFDGTTLAVAHVVLGTGFRAAGVRMALTSVQLLARRDYQQRTFAAIDEAALWLAPRLDPTADPRTVVTALRAHLAQVNLKVRATASA